MNQQLQNEWGRFWCLISENIESSGRLQWIAKNAIVQAFANINCVMVKNGESSVDEYRSQAEAWWPEWSVARCKQNLADQDST